MNNELNITPVAYIRNGFTDKFGIPRQPVRDSRIESRIVFAEPYRVPEALRGIEGYSHLWLLWGFHHNRRTQWSPTVRPPRLGGNQRVGVFATRSPIRPNPIGLTVVKLLRVEKGREGWELVVTGADMQDGTPVYDIKPYVAYADAVSDARCGFVDEVEFPVLEVVWQESFRSSVPRDEWEEILRQDPRPAYQDDPERVYHIAYRGEELTFRVEGVKLLVLDIR